MTRATPRVIRKSRSEPDGAVLIGGPARTVPKYLVYGVWTQGDVYAWEEDTFDIYLLPAGSDASWLDYQGVICFAGCFLHSLPKEGTPDDFMRPRPPTSLAELDRREGEAESLVRSGKLMAFMVPPVPLMSLTLALSDHAPDLMVRLLGARRVSCTFLDTPDPRPTTIHPTFTSFIERYPTAYAVFSLDGSDAPAIELAACSSGVSAAAIDRCIVVASARIPTSQADCIDLISRFLHSVLDLHKQADSSMPAWLLEMSLPAEEDALREAARLENLALAEREKIVAIQRLRHALLMGTGDPLVDTVVGILRETFGLPAESRPRVPPVEDAVLLGADGSVAGVLEIKGKKGNFVRDDISQSNDHRRRNGLSVAAPAIAIINTYRGAESVEVKDQPPHPDRVAQAVHDGVLLLRALDLYRLVGLKERHLISADNVQTLLLTKRGWLEVLRDRVELHTTT